MKLPEDIDIATILEFEQNYNLVFEGYVQASWELEESQGIQDVINDDYATLEARYNEYARAYNDHTETQSERTDNALLLARTAFMYSGLVGEGEAPAQREAAAQLLTRIIFSEMIETLNNDLPDNSEEHIDFYRSTQIAEEQYMPFPYRDDEEY